MNSQTSLSTEQFLDDLIAEMHMSDAPENELNKLKNAMRTQLDHVIMTAVSILLEPETIDYVMGRLTGDESSDLIFAELVENSPQSQIGIIAAMEQYREDTLDAYNELSKAA